MTTIKKTKPQMTEIHLWTLETPLSKHVSTTLVKETLK